MNLHKVIGGSEQRVQLAEAQGVVFAERPKRGDLLRLALPTPQRRVRVAVHRNQPFEYVASVLPPFAAYAGYVFDIAIGDYDDSLGFSATPESDVELVWLDFDRYGGLSDQDLLAWLTGRVAQRRKATRAPILVAARVGERVDAFNDALAKSLEKLPGVHVVPQNELAAELGADYWTKRLVDASASKLSDIAHIATARRLAFHWIPAAVAPRLKAIALDLDDTLYQGVLGEDGPEGIVLTDGHAELQRRLLAARESGLFLALVSQNNLDDVKALFAARPDFALQLEHFSTLAISWGSKGEAIRCAAAELRIGADAVLFVDDNVGQLATVASVSPETPSLHASEDGAKTARALDLYPGLFSWGADETDALRANDLSAATERQALLDEAGSDPNAYLESLGVTLTYALDSAADRERIHSLSHKTNQFNLGLRRLSETDVAERLAQPDFATVTFRLNDRLADSGLVGVVWGRRGADGTAVVEDICVSCRALGRRLEDAMLVTAINRIASKFEASRVAIDFSTGPRNQPARDWLAAFAGDSLPGEQGQLRFDWSTEAQAAKHCAVPVTISWKE